MKSKQNTNIVVPPSYLGFVCKPDLPPHVNVFFKANKPLPVLTREDYSKPRKNYGGVFEDSSIENYLYKDVKLANEKNKNNKFYQLALNNKENESKLKESISNWDPKKDPNIKSKSNSEKTLFVGRLDYKVTEQELERNFKVYGRIESIRLVKDYNNKSRGYGFVEFSSRDSADEAYDKMDRKYIKNKRIIVDYEKGRTRRSFVPTKLGGKNGRYREYPSYIKKELESIYQSNPELKPDNLEQYRKDLCRKQEKEQDRIREKEREERRAKEREERAKGDKQRREKSVSPSADGWDQKEKKLNGKEEKEGENNEDLNQINLNKLEENFKNEDLFDKKDSYNNENSNNNGKSNLLSKKRVSDSRHFKHFKEKDRSEEQVQSPSKRKYDNDSNSRKGTTEDTNPQSKKLQISEVEG